MWTRYYTPSTLQEAVELLAAHGEGARIVAGATDLILELERGQRPGVDILVDISRIPGQDQITFDDEGWVHLGPLVTHNHCAGSELIQQRAFTLARACWQVGAPQIRNRGTVAGNIITASPANDAIPPLMALGAQLTLLSADGERTVPIDDFYTGVRKTVMKDGELMSDIAFPALAENARTTFVKLGLRRAQAISVVNAAVVLLIKEGRIEHSVITLGSVAPTIIHATEAESYLTGMELQPDVIEKAAELAALAARPINDLRGSAVYRQEMVRVCTLRALRQIKNDREREGFPENPVMLRGRSGFHPVQPLSNSMEHHQDMLIETTINGKPHSFNSGFNKTLLRLLREEGGLPGTKEGCAEGECGACTVYLDGVAVMACMVPAPRAHGAEIVTIEGLGQDDKLHPIQQAFIEEGAVQCGYCTPGFLMAGAKLFEEQPEPDLSSIQQAITGNLCRCTGYYKILTAFERAAELMHQGSES
ncbi:MAG: 2Fe-2S iron-sulfur cluster binding domain-containing protein [Anaerolineales bacterium]|nr:MAG: 2Fe-2S iron-sulfur cluster binding domain-containing protein [Anaerolineales bacterium]